MEQLESRALGKPKETVATEPAESEEDAAMRVMTPEERRILLRPMNEAEAEAARGAPKRAVRPRVERRQRGRPAHHPA
jgi:hypothetical protein